MVIFMKKCMFINLLVLKTLITQIMSLSLRNPFYGLKQAPRAWYERLSKFLLENQFVRGKVDTTLFCKSFKNDIMFGSANPSLCQEFSKLMQVEFEMSLMGELKFFLGIQIDQRPEATYIHQSKYTKELLKKFNMLECTTAKTP